MRARGRRATGRPLGPASLTAHERRLVALAMTGQTNSAIAQSFGVSRRAVEFHFTHIYRKLGINRRPQLLQFAAVWA
jgi:DNA-binding CsgD family transcriptional regulator